MAITLTTDFGLEDGYTGVMKGVILQIAQDVPMVDITHKIRPQAIRQAAYILGASYSFFPAGSVHLCVVDPGVGSERRSLVVSAGGHYFTGPDNGVFTRIYLRHPDYAAYEITNKELMAEHISFTFHGRDIFAPAAARLALGAPPESFGPAVDDPVLIDAKDATMARQGLIRGTIVYIDRYGNAVTNIDIALVEKVNREGEYKKFTVSHHAGKTDVILKSYSQAPDKMALCVTVGSWNTLEFFTLTGHAANIHGLCVNDNVEVRFS